MLKISGNVVNGLKEMWTESFFKNTFRDRRGKGGGLEKKKFGRDTENWPSEGARARLHPTRNLVSHHR